VRRWVVLKGGVKLDGLLKPAGSVGRKRHGRLGKERRGRSGLPEWHRLHTWIMIIRVFNFEVQRRGERLRKRGRKLEGFKRWRVVQGSIR